jgi:hypothetical protein
MPALHVIVVFILIRVSLRSLVVLGDGCTENTLLAYGWRSKFSDVNSSASAKSNECLLYDFNVLSLQCRTVCHRQGFKPLVTLPMT